MFDVGSSLRAALDGARDDLESAQREVVLAQSRGGGRGADAAMAATAKAAIFSEALLGAERARFEELKAVTK